MAKEKTKAELEAEAKEAVEAENLAKQKSAEEAEAKAKADDKAKEVPPVKSKEEKEKEEDAARKAKIDAINKEKAKKAAEKEAKLANTPLSKAEKEFIIEIKAKMNEGRAVMQPSPAEILRYSQLLKRKDVK